MSHFVVIVIGDNIEEQLAPFQENNMGDCPKEYLEFNDITDKERESYATGTTRGVRMPDGKILSKYDERFRDPDPLASPRYVVPDDCEEFDCPLTEAYSTFEIYMRDYVELEPNDEGRYGYWENPNAKWDYWVLGGRWSGYFPVRPSLPDTMFGVNMPEDPGRTSPPIHGIMARETRERGRRALLTRSADWALKSAVDVERMMNEAEVSARKAWSFWAPAIANRPAPRELDDDPRAQRAQHRGCTRGVPRAACDRRMEGGVSEAWRVHAVRDEPGRGVRVRSRPLHRAQAPCGTGTVRVPLQRRMARARQHGLVGLRVGRERPQRVGRAMGADVG